MALSPDQLLVIRGEIGDDDPPSNVDLATYFDSAAVGGSTVAVVLYVLRKRLAEVLAGAGSYSISGVYSEDNRDVIKGLQEQIARVESGGVGVDPNAEPPIGARLVRRGRSRAGRY